MAKNKNQDAGIEICASVFFFSIMRSEVKIMVRFLHISNLHLDRAFSGVSMFSDGALQVIRESTFVAWQKIVQYAIDERPDFLLIVGDSYDGTMRSLRAQKSFQQGMLQLEAHQIPVILSYGAADYAEGEWARFALPTNVTVLPTKTTTITLPIKDETIAITGCSYATRQMPTALLDTYPKAKAEQLHIGVLYGGGEIKSLAEKNYDYFALGGRPTAEVLQRNPRIAYSGTTQSTAIQEVGVKGFYDVTLTKASCTMQFVRSAAVVCLQQEVDASAVRYANDLMALCHNVCQSLRDNAQATIVTLTLTNLTTEGYELWHSSTPAQWLQVMRDMESEQLPLVFIAAIKITTSAPRPATNAAQQVIATMHSWQQDDWQQVLAGVYQNGMVARLMQEQPLDSKQVLHEAEQLFLRKMQES